MPCGYRNDSSGSVAAAHPEYLGGGFGALLANGGLPCFLPLCAHLKIDSKARNFSKAAFETTRNTCWPVTGGTARLHSPAFVF
jgi:hypothetical protein